MKMAPAKTLGTVERERESRILAKQSIVLVFANLALYLSNKKVKIRYRRKIAIDLL